MSVKWACISFYPGLNANTRKKSHTTEGVNIWEGDSYFLCPSGLCNNGWRLLQQLKCSRPNRLPLSQSFRLVEKRTKPVIFLGVFCFFWVKFLTLSTALLVCSSDLPSLSPQLHAALKVIERWTQTFHDKLESFQGPPPDFISQFPVSQDGFHRGGRALMRYKALLDPLNTPFRYCRLLNSRLKHCYN